MRLAPRSPLLFLVFFFSAADKIVKKKLSLTLLEPQSRFGGKPLNFQVVGKTGLRF